MDDEARKAIWAATKARSCLVLDPAAMARQAEERRAEAPPVVVEQHEDEHNTATCRCGECFRWRADERARRRELATVERRKAEAHRAALVDPATVNAAIRSNSLELAKGHARVVIEERKVVTAEISKLQNTIDGVALRVDGLAHETSKRLDEAERRDAGGVVDMWGRYAG